MDQRKRLLLLLLPVLLAIPAFPGTSVLASTDQDEGEVTTDVTESSSNGIIGTVQNISQPVNILSHSAREDGGYLHVVGEVENGLSRSIDYLQVTGTFYDVNKKVIGTDFTFTDPQTLEAGETAPFDLTLFTDAVEPSEVASYKLRVSWQ